MRALVVAAALLCCNAAPVHHRLLQTFLFIRPAGPAVLRIPKPGINLVETQNSVTVPEEESVPISRVPSPVLIKRLDVPPIDEEEVLLEEQDPVYRNSPVPVPIQVLLEEEFVERPGDSALSVPGNDLSFDVQVEQETPAPNSVSLPVVVAAAPEPLDAPAPPMPSLDVPHVGGQFHAQDELKQYSFGHYGGPNTRVETRDALGRTLGSFAYVNPTGDVEIRKYAAAPSMGFKVAASDLPVDTPEVALLKAVHQQAHLSFLSLRDEVL